MNILDQELTEPPTTMGNARDHGIHRTMMEWKSKYLKALEVQNAMEAEVEQLTADKQSFLMEISNLRMESQNHEIEMAHLTKQLVHGQSSYMEQISFLSEEVSQLRARNRTLEQEKETLEHKIEEQKSIESPKPSPEPTIVLTEELLGHHEQLKEKVRQVEQVNERLSEENDALQFLLSENTISGQFPSFEVEGTATLDAELGDHLDSIPPSPDMGFELKSAQNYIQALKVSLESLVQRLLENREFEKAMEQTIGSRKISAFTERRRKAIALVDPPKYSPDEQQYWSNLLTPKKRTSGTRTFSMGVDERLSDSSSCSDAGSTLVNEISLPKRPVTTTQTALRKLSLG